MYDLKHRSSVCIGILLHFGSCPVTIQQAKAARQVTSLNNCRSRAHYCYLYYTHTNGKNTATATIRISLIIAYSPKNHKTAFTELAKHPSYFTLTITTMNCFLITLCLLMVLSLANSWRDDDRCFTSHHLEHQIHRDTLFDIEDLTEETIEESDSSARLLTESELQGGRRFNLKMHWKEGYCWQHEWIERRWCMECAGSDCNEDDVLEIQVCETSSTSSKRQEFKWLPAEEKGAGRLKVSNKNLCLERVSVNFFKLKPCTVSVKQILVGFKADGPFELHPQGDENKCLNQHHHPKPFEEVYTTTCSLAKLYYTNQWEAVWANDSSVGGKVHVPKEAAPKLVENDDSSLKIRTRVLRAGIPALVRPIRDCSDSNQCKECEGDCDRDSQCKGNLVCFQKDGYLPVPGCSGHDGSNTDWCVDPNKVAYK